MKTTIDMAREVDRKGEHMKRPVESDYTSHVAYTRALEEYCDWLRQHTPVPWSQALESVWAEPDEATPPAAQRQWVGLTDEEINTAASCQSWRPFARAIEAKLKEKNT